MISTKVANWISYSQVIEYLVCRGWVEAPSRRRWAAVYRTPGEPGERAEVQIPLARTDDYALAIKLAVIDIALHEGRAEEDVVTSITHGATRPD